MIAFDREFPHQVAHPARTVPTAEAAGGGASATDWNSMPGASRLRNALPSRAPACCRRRGHETRCPFAARSGSRRSRRAPADDRNASTRRRCRTLHPGPDWNRSGPISVAVRVSAFVRRRQRTRSGAIYKTRSADSRTRSFSSAAHN